MCAWFTRRRKISAFSAAIRTISNGRATPAILLSCALMSRRTANPPNIRRTMFRYKPKKFLTISLTALKENDFVFVMGYPGSTTRYRESQSIEYSENVTSLFCVDI